MTGAGDAAGDWPDLVGGPPTADAAAAVAVADVRSRGGVVEVPVVVWSADRRVVQVLGAGAGGGLETRDVEVGAYLGMGLALVGAGVPLLPPAGAVATPGWALVLDRAGERYTVIRPDGGVAITASYRPRSPGEARVVAAWVRAVEDGGLVVLLTGDIPFEGTAPDLTGARRAGTLLRGVAGWTDFDPPGGQPPMLTGRQRGRWWDRLRRRPRR